MQWLALSLKAEPPEASGFGFRDRHRVLTRKNSYPPLHDVQQKVFDEVRFIIADFG
jgi:hypothetical protein